MTASRGAISAVLFSAIAVPAQAQEAVEPSVGTTVADTTAATGQRAAENAVRSADDAFGTSIGREIIGIYNSSNVRGFSPTTAGIIRIDDMYSDLVWRLNSRLRRITNIRVDLSALGIRRP